MKLTYKIYEIVDAEVCVPSTDFYARGNDWQTETLCHLRFVQETDSMEQALQVLGEFSPGAEYTILPTYKK